VSSFRLFNGPEAAHHAHHGQTPAICVQHVQHVHPFSHLSINRRDFVLKTALPIEERRVGYAVTEKIIYRTWERFGDIARPLIAGLLKDLVQRGVIVEAPFPNCYQRAQSPARDRA
jgi:hypothetical protein